MNLDLTPSGSMNRPANLTRESGVSRWLTGLVFIAAISWLLYIPDPRSVAFTDLKAGDIAPSDIVIRRNLTLVDPDATRVSREIAEKAVPPVYEFDTQAMTGNGAVFTRFLERTSEWRRGGATPAEATAGFQREFGVRFPEEAVRRLLRSEAVRRIDWTRVASVIEERSRSGLFPPRSELRVGSEGTLRALGQNGRGTPMQKGGAYDPSDLKNELHGAFIGFHLPPVEAEMLAQLVGSLVAPTMVYSPLRTREDVDRVLATLSPVTLNFKQGKVLLRRGDEAQPDLIRTLRLIHAEEGQQRDRPFDITLILTVLGLIFVFLWKFYAGSPFPGPDREKAILVIGSTLLVSVAIYRLCALLFPVILGNLVPTYEWNPQTIPFAIPYATGALVIAFLFNLQHAVIFAILNALVGGIAAGWSIKVSLLVFLGNAAAALGLEHYQRMKRSSMLKAGFFWLLPVQLLIVLSVLLSEGIPGWNTLLATVSLALLAAVFSVLLANFLIPLWEYLFKLITDLKLVEITNLNLPVFREMLEKAPGTYHHSQMVAALAEAAAQELGLSSSMLRAMALYHDIGKVQSPNFFTENHSVYENPHPTLSPRESTKAIIGHISAGLEMAEQLKLPQRIRDAIVQHHGTKRVTYFLEKARDQASGTGETIDETVFRYPGVRPREIEEAIIMLADQVEAASKSLTAPGDEEIRNVVDRIIAANVADHQFDECKNLTFRSLNLIAGSFYEKLTSIYHQRVSYPGFDFSATRKI